MRPITLKAKGVIVPCSKCPVCIARRVSGWSFRLMQQDKQSLSSHFITLTYDTKYIPITPKGNFSLQKQDLQNFFKRLRKAHSGSASSLIKYYAVGEYGGKSKRPHYHIILFNADLDHIQASWKQGHIYYGQVSGASVGYTLKYISKQKRKRTDPTDTVPEFALMSKGLGLNYLSPTMLKFHTHDLLNRMYCTTNDGVKLSMPRYYKDKIYDEVQRKAIADAYAIINHEKQWEKISKQTVKTLRNEMAAIDAAFDKMYKSSLKTKI